jgi:hypothetical protein
MSNRAKRKSKTIEESLVALMIDVPVQLCGKELPL